MSRKHIRKEGQSRNPSLVVSVTKRKRTVSPKYQNRKTYLMAIKDYKRFCSLFYKYMCFLRSANMLSVNNSLTASLPRVLCHWRSGLCPQAGHSCSHQAVPTRQGRSTRGRQLTGGHSTGSRGSWGQPPPHGRARHQPQCHQHRAAAAASNSTPQAWCSCVNASELPGLCLY